MVIKHVALDIVCGITSKLPQNEVPEMPHFGKIQCGKIITDQCTDEPESPGKNQLFSGKNPDH